MHICFKKENIHGLRNILTFGINLKDCGTNIVLLYKHNPSLKHYMSYPSWYNQRTHILGNNQFSL